MARRRPTPPPTVVAVSQEELTAIVDRARRGPLSDEECSKLQGAVETLAWVLKLVETGNRALKRLRRLFGLDTDERRRGSKGAKPEKGQDEPEPSGGDTGAPGEPQDAGPASRAEPGPERPENAAASTSDDAARANGEARRPGHGRNGADQYPGADRVPVPHEGLSAGGPCPNCTTPQTGPRGKLYPQPPSTVVRVTAGPPLRVTLYDCQRLRCGVCGAVFVAALPATAGTEKYDARAAAMIGLLKYGSGLPFNRLARLEGNLGIPLPAATQWEIVENAADRLAPVHEALLAAGAQAPRGYNDDTSVEILELRKQIEAAVAKHSAHERTGIFTAAALFELAEGPRVAIFRTGQEHAGELLNDVLKRRAPTLPKMLQMSDGADRNVPGDFETIVANCLVHARRNFIDVEDAFPAECGVVFDALAEVYKHEAHVREHGFSDADRLAYHKSHSKPVMARLLRWMREQVAQKRIEPNSGLGQAVNYMLKRWKKLTRFLHVPGAPLDNNSCERALKKAILHRKNALFYKTENGARVGDCFMTLVYTAELNGVNAFAYLVALLEHGEAVRQVPAEWLPWNYGSALARVATSR